MRANGCVVAHILNYSVGFGRLQFLVEELANPHKSDQSAINVNLIKIKVIIKIKRFVAM